MSNRITEKWLEKRVALLNTMLNRPQTMATERDGKQKTNIGHLHIDHAYGGVDLMEITNEGGACHSWTNRHGTKRELDTFITGAIAALYAIEKRGTA